MMERFTRVPGWREAWRVRWGRLPRGWRIAVQSVFAVLLLAFIASVAFRRDLADWIWPDSRAEALRIQAGQALAAGRLSMADGNGARELYEAALALQPDQLQAREGLSRVALAALKQAQAHARAGREAQARIALRLARELDAPRVRIEAIESDLRMGAAAQAGIGALLAAAQSAQAGGRLLEGIDAALPLYQRVLALQPRNQRALEGREDALADLLNAVPERIARDDLAGATARVRAAERFDPGHVDLPASNAALARAWEQRAARIRRWLASGELVRAAEACIALRAVDPMRAPGECDEGVVDAVLRAARAATADLRFAQAANMLALASQLDGDAVRVESAARQLRTAQADASHLPRAKASPRANARVRDLLAQAERARLRGDWLTPPGDSAWDRLREARVLAPADPAVQAALRGMLPAARECNAAALRDNDLGLAQVCLDAWRQLAPGDAGMASAQRRLALRWLAIADERVGAGEVQAAQRALGQAAKLDPAVPGLTDLRRRIEHASAGGE